MVADGARVRAPATRTPRGSALRSRRSLVRVLAQGAGGAVDVAGGAGGGGGGGGGWGWEGGATSGTSGTTTLSGDATTLEARLRRIPEFADMVMLSRDARLQLEGVMQIRKLLSIERGPPIQDVIDTGIVPTLVDLLRTADNAKLQFEAAWALTNIASGTAAHTRVVVEAEATPLFVELLDSPDDNVREQCVWALGNVAGDCPAYRDMVLGMNALRPVLNVIRTATKPSMLRNATWTLSNLCRGKPQPKFDLVRDALPTLAMLLRNSDEDVLTDACWALSYISDGPNERIQGVCDTGVLRRLVEFLHHPNPSVQTPALRTIGNIVTGDDEQTQAAISAGALGALLTLLGSPRKGIVKETCWALSNITAGSQAQIQAVINEGLIQPLVAICMDAPFDIRKEAAWALSNACSGGTNDQVRHVVQRGGIGPMCNLLAINDNRVITVALDTLENMLRVAEEDSEVTGESNYVADHIEEVGGLDKLLALQSHINQDIYRRVLRILREYFGAESEDEAEPEDMGTTTPGDGPDKSHPNGGSGGFGGTTSSGGFGGTTGTGGGFSWSKSGGSGW